jgi:hypothetical protein
VQELLDILCTDWLLVESREKINFLLHSCVCVLCFLLSDTRRSS